jgi:acyl-CoA reductase-like NAD-dependent aldehyde dehydrogenase
MSNGNIVTADNYIGGKSVAPSTGDYSDVTNPADFHTVGKVGLSGAKDVNDAVAAAEGALPAWSSRTIKSRAALVSCFLR